MGGGGNVEGALGVGVVAGALTVRGRETKRWRGW